MNTSKEKDAYMQMMGARGGRTAAARMTPEERLKRSLKAARTRWGLDNDAGVPVKKKTPPKGPKPRRAEAEPEQ